MCALNSIPINMNPDLPSWHKKVKALLLRHGYVLDDPDTSKDLHARTGLDEDVIRQLLNGESTCSVDALIKVATVLNFPVAEFFSSASTVKRIYNIDGSAPVTVVLPQELTSLTLTEGEADTLFYADGLADGLGHIHPDCIVVCSRGFSVPEVGMLYLLESDTARFVRRCSAVSQASHQATMNEDGEHTAPIVVFYKNLKLVTSATPMVMGRVLWSVSQH